jgi:hypothetical protein
MKKFLLTGFIFLSLTGILSAQGDFFYGDNSFRAVFKDKSDAVIPGLRLVIKRGDVSATRLTDINGNISANLHPGDYEITIADTDPSYFRAFIRLGNGALYLNPVEFAIDADGAFAPKKPRPAITKFVYPSYPPAAKAMRVMGEVSVTVIIDKEGKVISGNPLSGHPLLKSASWAAAAQFLFEPSADIAQRTAILCFVYLDSAKTQDVRRYENPYRLAVANELTELDIITTRESE